MWCYDNNKADVDSTGGRSTMWVPSGATLKVYADNIKILPSSYGGAGRGEYTYTAELTLPNGATPSDGFFWDIGIIGGGGPWDWQQRPTPMRLLTWTNNTGESLVVPIATWAGRAYAGAGTQYKVRAEVTGGTSDPAPDCSDWWSDVLERGMRGSDGHAGDPVSTSSGNLVHQAEDIELGTESFGGLVRTYNSIRSTGFVDPGYGRTGVFGPGWSTLLDTRVEVVDSPAAGEVLRVRMPDGMVSTLVDPTTSSGVTSWDPGDRLLLKSAKRNANDTFELRTASEQAWTFDADGRLLTVESAFGDRLTIARRTDGFPTSVTTAHGSTALWRVDIGINGDLLVSSLTGPYAASESTPPAGTPQVTYKYDAARRLEVARHPVAVGSSTDRGEVYTWDAHERISTIKRDKTASVRDLVVSSTFDSLDRVTQQTLPAGEVDTFTYDLTSTGMRTTIEHAKGSVVEETTYIHDESGRLIQIIDPYEETTGHTWDRDLPASTTSRRGGEAISTYDGAGRATETAQAHPTTPGAQAGVSEVTYCGANDPRPVDVTDTAGLVTRYFWTTGSSPTPCEAGRTVPIKVTHAFGTSAAWDTTYDSSNGLVTLETEAPGTSGDNVATRYNWNSQRQLTSKVVYPSGPSAAGNTTYLGYDAAGRQLVTRDPIGVETWTLRDAAGRVTSQVGPVAVSRSCSATDCTFGTTPPTGPTQVWSFNLDGSLASYQDQANKTTTYSSTYTTGGGRVEVVTAPSHGDSAASPSSTTKTVTTSTYDEFDRLETVETGDPAKSTPISTVTNTYDPLGRLATTSQSVGGSAPALVTSYDYDDDGNQTIVAHGSNPADTTKQQSQRVYDLRGRLIEEWGPTGDTTAPASVSGSAPTEVRQHSTWTYDAATDRLLAETTGDGATKSQTFYRYDDLGRVRYVITDRDGDGDVSSSPTGGPTDPTDGVIQYTYTPAGRLKSMIEGPVDVTTYDWTGGNQALKRTTTYNYDKAGQQTGIVDALNRTTSQTYTASGQRLKRTLPGNYYTENTFDDAGRIAKVKKPSPTGTGTAEVDYSYDARGLLTAETVEHDSTVTNPAATTRTYWDDGLLKSVTNPLGTANDTVSYYYDARGNRTERTSTTKASSVATAHQVVDTWEYDLANRVTQEKPAGDSVGTTYTYDPTTGAQATKTMPSGRVQTTTYWNSGLPRSVTSTKAADAFGPADSYRACTWYDASGNATHILGEDAPGTTACAAGDITVQTWDRMGYQTGYQAPDTPNTPSGQDEVFTYTYDLGGRPRTLTYADGTVHQFLHDKLGRLRQSAIVWSGGGGFPIVGYDYDTNGNITKENVNWSEAVRTWTFPSNGSAHPTKFVQQVPGGNRTTDMTWRADGRLGTETTGSSTRTYSYDAAGQLTSRADTAGVTDTYTYGPRGLRLASTHGSASVAYTYNDRAQLVASSHGGTDNRTCSYDPDGRRIGLASPAYTRQTGYDARGKPVTTTTDTATDDVTETSTYNVQGQLTTQSIAIGSGTPSTWSFIWDQTRPEAAPIEMRVNDTLWSRSNYGLELVGLHLSTSGSAVYYGFDTRRSVLPTTSNTSAPADYDAYGTPAHVQPLNYGYRTQIHNLDEIHLRNRNYQPDTGQFLTPDPLDGIPGTTTETNPYHYTDNDPVNKTDFLGLSPSDPDISPATVCGVGLIMAASDGPIPLGDIVGASACGAAVTWMYLTSTGVVEAPTLELPDVSLPHPPGPEPKPQDEEEETRLPRPPTPQPPPRCEGGEDECDAHGGRIQVQGNRLSKEPSWAWPRSGIMNRPPTAAEGLAGLDSLWRGLPRRDQKMLNQAFERARTYVRHCAPVGCPTPGRNGFTNRGVKGSDARVDIEILRGRAFT